MSGERSFDLSLRLVHEFGRWRLIADGGRTEIDAAAALSLVKRVAKIAPEHDHRERVRERIRLDAHEAEQAADLAQQRAQQESERLARSTFSTQQDAIERRAEADRLAPQPEPY